MVDITPEYGHLSVQHGASGTVHLTTAESRFMYLADSTPELQVGGCDTIHRLALQALVPWILVRWTHPTFHK
jgi:hypothetical protein